MKQVFADTSYWMALLNPRDQLHDKAVAVSQSISVARIVTSEMVLTELLNGFSEAGPQLRRSVAQKVTALDRNPNVLIVPQTPGQFSNAARLYEQAADKSWSLTDCASFQVMEEKQIHSALTHDKHFPQAGFEALLR